MRCQITCSITYQILEYFVLQKLRQTTSGDREAIRRFTSEVESHIPEPPGDYQTNRMLQKVRSFHFISAKFSTVKKV